MIFLSVFISLISVHGWAEIMIDKIFVPLKKKKFKTKIEQHALLK